jgi:RimJ/RimL family protein N-acetyltransferase
MTPKIIKTFTSSKGNTVTIRYLTRTDLDELLRYVNELIKEDTFVQLSGRPLKKTEEQKFLNSALLDMAGAKGVTLIAECKNSIIGIAGIKRGILRKSHVGEPGLSVAKAYRGEGIGTIFFSTLFEEAKKIGVRVIILTCFEDNKQAVHVYEKLGFKKVGSVPGAIAFKGSFVPELYMYLPL